MKPAHEIICLARKPLGEKTVAANISKWGTGAINIDGCRVPWANEVDAAGARAMGAGFEKTRAKGRALQTVSLGKESRDGTERYDPYAVSGRWPANLLHDGSEEVVAAFPKDAARFFYSPKANKADRAGSNHPTVKPIALMRYLTRLITPPGGTVLDPFAGSGSTGEAAYLEGFNSILIEKNEQYCADIRSRMAAVEQREFDRLMG